jgi:hypothetical protein
MVKVYVYKDSSGTYRVEPGVVVIPGGHKLRVVNASNTRLKVTLPAGASNPSDPVTKPIEPRSREDFNTRSQGAEKARAYNYDVVTLTGKRKSARGNSDPVLIIEN